MDTELEEGAAIAIAGIRELTEQLDALRAVRAEYLRVHGWQRSREAFAELDAALKALRKAARR